MCAHLAIYCQIKTQRRNKRRNADLLEEVSLDSDTNGKKMLHSFFVNEFLFYFLIFLSITSTISESIDSPDDNDETIVEGKRMHLLGSVFQFYYTEMYVQCIRLLCIYRVYIV